jgi:hypothetical protein
MQTMREARSLATAVTRCWKINHLRKVPNSKPISKLISGQVKVEANCRLHCEEAMGLVLPRALNSTRKVRGHVLMPEQTLIDALVAGATLYLKLTRSSFALFLMQSRRVLCTRVSNGLN